MSDSIRLDVHYTDDMGHVSDEHVEITPDLARQIVALGLDGISPKTLAALDRGMADSLAGRVTPYQPEGLGDQWRAKAWAAYCEDSRKNTIGKGVNACPGSRWGYDSWESMPQVLRDEYACKVAEDKVTLSPEAFEQVKAMCADEPVDAGAEPTPVDAGGEDDAQEIVNRIHLGTTRQCDAARIANIIAALRARVDELERHNSDLAVSVQHYGAERDRALADLAACESDYKRVRADFGGRMVEERERADKAEADLAAERERREKAEAHLASSLATVAPYNDVCMERDAARAEVAALKARKVSVGWIKCPYEMSETVRQCAYYRGVSDCADAIRAAGVEVSDE